MKGVLVALGEFAGRPAAARVINGLLDDLLIDPADPAPFRPEAILRGIVGRPLKGMGGVFVDLPGSTTGFLRQIKGLRSGQPLLAQVAGHAEPGKAVPLTARLLIKGRYAILTPQAPGLNVARGIRDPAARDRLLAAAGRAMAGAPDTLGLILRTAAEFASDDTLADEISGLRALAEQLLAEPRGGPALLLPAPGSHALAMRDWMDPAPDTRAEGPTTFADHGIDALIDALLAPLVPLPGGASMSVEPTRALVAVDVNTGAETGPAAGLKANLAAARDLPRQLRLRGLGGQITVDFAPMPKRDRQTLEQSLRAAFRRDNVETTLAGWTPLGHYELQRRRDRLPLTECLAR
jgi:ribonuclease G